MRDSRSVITGGLPVVVARLLTRQTYDTRSDGAQRTQLEIATHLGIDKSTLVPLLDRLERDGLIIRATSERDRRVRIPQATPAGLKVVKDVAIARDAARPPRLTP
jgi:DNA-binding MarR family transcriptional regulator